MVTGVQACGAELKLFLCSLSFPFIFLVLIIGGLSLNKSDPNTPESDINI